MGRDKAVMLGWTGAMGSTDNQKGRNASGREDGTLAWVERRCADRGVLMMGRGSVHQGHEPKWRKVETCETSGVLREVKATI